MEYMLRLAKQFDKQQKHISCTALPPTKESIEKIEDCFGFKLPKSLITFAQNSERYGNWLASIGEDYDSPTHIININKEESEELPKNFVIFNVGYDEDYDCFDLDTYDDETDEYLITYWYPGIDLKEASLHDSFFNNMAAQIRGWEIT